uniref:Uncharacterized protein n=1 Tax=Nelumbo nucifera TaxID=4432 RepID=A0A822YFI1_NELNU|nr:TPA_asm: hypothetical protein HUJ06_031224 [Nelumbo nucifera]
MIVVLNLVQLCPRSPSWDPLYDSFGRLLFRTYYVILICSSSGHSKNICFSLNTGFWQQRKAMLTQHTNTS